MKQLFHSRTVLIAAVFSTVATAALAIGVNARIKGTVVDPSGAAIPGAQVTATNQDTGVKFTTTSQANGSYAFLQLPIGTYTISAAAPGFKGFSATGIVLNIDQEFVEPVQLSVGNTVETVEVQADAVQVNTTDMQLDNIVDSHQITELPLIGRGFTGLELILPGVQQSNDRFGSFSVNGSQSQQSSYLINGADSNDLPLNTVGIQPNIDALAQFNLVTGPLNAEYDRSSGGIVSTAIKQGTNHFHGDVFEFYRDTFLNTRGFFQTKASKYHQNIFGGTLGGPLLRDKLFFFGAYQGIRQTVPQTGTNYGNVNVFTPAQLAGNFSGAKFSQNVIPGTISIPGCASGVQTFASCLASGQVPTGAFDPISLNLINKYVPLPNGAGNAFTYNPVTGTTQNQYIGRFDVNPTTKDQFYFVGIHQFQNANDTLPFTGATLPGFGDKSISSIYQFSAGYTRQLSSTAVNDFQLHYTRFNFDLVEPQNVVDPASLGFAITPQNAAAAGVPAITFSGKSLGTVNFELGFSTNGPQPRIDQVYQADDNFSKVVGHHNLKFGYDGRRYNVSNPFYARNSGSFNFNSGGGNPDTSGDAGLDFLLGIPGSYSQGSGAVIDAYAFLNYLYAQDTWKATDSLTVSYGLGYQIDTPLHNLQYGGIGVTCYIPGQQSKVFTSAPAGLDYPGDPGCNNASGAKTKYGDFGPRIGFAFAPNLGRLSGGDAKKLSIRAGYGIYYNRSEEETSLQNLQDPPFGLNTGGAPDYGVATNPSFANPFIDLNTGAVNPNKFPFVPPPAGSSPDYSQFLPLQLSQYAPGFRSPYSENFQLTLEREFPGKVLARASYVGTLGRHNQIEIEGNPITQAGHDACLADVTCSGTFLDTQAFHYPTHTQFGFADPNFQGLNDFASIGLISTEGSSNYNSLQLSVDKGLTHGLQFQASYTLAHAMDDGSSFEDAGFGGAGGVNGSARGYNQYVKGASYGNSSYDVRHRFVFAPIYVVPFKTTGSAFSVSNLLLSGWQVSAIATFATGFPFDISYAGGESYSLYCGAGVSYYACPDVPNQTGPLVLANSRVKVASANRTRFFQTQNFTDETLGTFGNVSRNKYHGPGTDNTNLIVAKNFSLSSDATRYLQLRMESDNVFNHTNFSNPVGNFDSSAFGEITTAFAARQTQLAAKIYF